MAKKHQTERKKGDLLLDMRDIRRKRAARMPRV